MSVKERINFFENLKYIANDNHPQRESDDEFEYLVNNRIIPRRIHARFTKEYQSDELLESIKETEKKINDILKIPISGKNEPCICRNCNIVFENDRDYQLHHCDITVDGIIPTDPKGEHICPTCGNKYSNIYLLGEHFTMSHNSYDDFCLLDVKNSNGFPGFDILLYINMIELFVSKESNLCEICYQQYDNNQLKLNCCSKLICDKCLKNHITTTDSILCPFCRHDHTYKDMDYITFVEISDTIDKIKWRKWWEKHVDIFFN